MSGIFLPNSASTTSEGVGTFSSAKALKAIENKKNKTNMSLKDTIFYENTQTGFLHLALLTLCCFIPCIVYIEKTVPSKFHPTKFHLIFKRIKKLLTCSLFLSLEFLSIIKKFLCETSAPHHLWYDQY